MMAVLFCCAGCLDTYIGSTDLYETDSFLCVENDRSCSSERKIAGKTVVDGFELSFYTQFKSRKKYEAGHYHVGRKYFYYDRKDTIVSDAWLFFPGVGYGVIVFGDFLAALGKGFADWQLYGENLPGIGYLIAYTPFINMVCTPFLRAPYVYEKDAVVQDKKEMFPQRKWVGKKVYYEHVDDYEYGTAGSQITVTCGKVSRDYLLDYKGSFSLDVKDFLSDIDPEGKDIAFRIYHNEWKKTWILTASPLCSGKLLRDWNIMVNNRYDYLSRAAAAARLSQYCGAERCRTYLQKLLNDQLRKKAVKRGRFMIREEKKAQSATF